MDDHNIRPKTLNLSEEEKNAEKNLEDRDARKDFLTGTPDTWNMSKQSTNGTSQS